MEEGKYVNQLTTENLIEIAKSMGFSVVYETNPDGSNGAPEIMRKDDRIYMNVTSYDKKLFPGVKTEEDLKTYVGNHPEVLEMYDRSVFCVKDFEIDVYTDCKYIRKHMVNLIYRWTLREWFGKEYFQDFREYKKECRKANKQKVSYEEGVGFEQEK